MNLVIGISIMVLCLVLEALLVVVLIRYYARREQLLSSASLLTSLSTIVVVMLLLLAGNLVQVGIWALTFRLLGEFQNFGDALYHSAVNFATLGYGDIIMSDARRVLGPLEAINGAMMIGVSTAVLMLAMQHAIRNTISARGGDSAKHE